MEEGEGPQLHLKQLENSKRHNNNYYMACTSTYTTHLTQRAIIILYLVWEALEVTFPKQ